MQPRRFEQGSRSASGVSDRLPVFDYLRRPTTLSVVLDSQEVSTPLINPLGYLTVDLNCTAGAALRRHSLR